MLGHRCPQVPFPLERDSPCSHVPGATPGCRDSLCPCVPSATPGRSWSRCPLGQLWEWEQRWSPRPLLHLSPQGVGTAPVTKFSACLGAGTAAVPTSPARSDTLGSRDSPGVPCVPPQGAGLSPCHLDATSVTPRGRGEAQFPQCPLHPRSPPACRDTPVPWEHPCATPSEGTPAQSLPALSRTVPPSGPSVSCWGEAAPPKPALSPARVGRGRSARPSATATRGAASQGPHGRHSHVPAGRRARGGPGGWPGVRTPISCHCSSRNNGRAIPRGQPQRHLQQGLHRGQVHLQHRARLQGERRHQGGQGLRGARGGSARPHRPQLCPLSVPRCGRAPPASPSARAGRCRAWG